MFFRRRAEQVLTVREQCSPAKSLEISHVTSYLVRNAHFYGVLRFYLARTTSAVGLLENTGEAGHRAHERRLWLVSYRLVLVR
jgi:hypothetical protein